MRALPKVQSQLYRTQKHENRLKKQNMLLRKKLSGFSTIMAKLKELKLINDEGEIALQVNIMMLHTLVKPQEVTHVL